MATSGTDDAGGSGISELHRTAKWHEPPEEIKEEDEFSHYKELKLFQSVAARLNYVAMATRGRSHRRQQSGPLYNQVSANGM